MQSEENNQIPTYKTNYPKKTFLIPRSTKDEKRIYLETYLDELELFGTVNNRWLNRQFGITDQHLYNLLQESNLVERYHAININKKILNKAGRSESLSGLRSLKSTDCPPKTKETFLKILVSMSGGKRLAQACKEFKWSKNKFHNILHRYADELDRYYQKAVQNKITKINRKRALDNLEALDLAHDVLMEKMEWREVAEITKKEGTIMQGGRVIPVQNETRKVVQKEPDLAAAKLMFQLNGMLKENKTEININTEVKPIGQFEENQVIELQDQDDRLLKQIEQEDSENMFEDWDD